MSKQKFQESVRGKFEIQPEPVDLRSTTKSWAKSTKVLDSQKEKLVETPQDLLMTKYPRTRSHAEIMRTTMKTFLTDLNIPFPPTKTHKKEESEDFHKLRRRSYATAVPEFAFFRDRIDKTVDKLQKLNEKFQKSLVLSNASGIRMQVRRGHVNISSPTSIPLASLNFRPSTKSKNKPDFPDYSNKDFESPDSNRSLIEAIRLIDGNKKSEAVVDAMWVDLNEGYKMYDHLVHERNLREKEMQNLQQYLKSLTLYNDNTALYNEITELNKQIDVADDQVTQDEMNCEILESMLQERKAHADLIKQRFTIKYASLPKVELGLHVGVNEIKKDTLQIENTMKSVGTMYTNLRSLQKLSKVRQNEFQLQIKENYQAERNIAVEQDFKEQREEYIKRKMKEEERERHKQEIELYERITQEIKDTEKQIDQMGDHVTFIMQRTKQSYNKEDILRLWHELLDKNDILQVKLQEAAAERDEMEARLAQEIQAIDLIKTKNIKRQEVNDIPELCRKEDEREKAQRDLEKDQEAYFQNQRLTAGYLAGFSKMFEDISKKKIELGIGDMKTMPCTEENLENVIEYLSHLVDRISKTDGSINQNQQFRNSQAQENEI